MNSQNPVSSPSSRTAEPRGKPSRCAGGWLWIDKMVVDHVRTAAESVNPLHPDYLSPASALSVLLAVCELSSDMQCDSFTITEPKIALKAGVAKRTCGKALKLLQTCFVVYGQPSGDGGGNGAKTYTLLRHTPPTCRICAAQRKPPETPAVLVLSEEPEKDNNKNSKSARPVAKSSRKWRVSDEPEMPGHWVIAARQEFPSRDDIERIGRKFWAHYAGDKRCRTQERFFSWIASERETPKAGKDLVSNTTGPVSAAAAADAECEPTDWRNFVPKNYPAETARIFLAGNWTDIPTGYRNDIVRDMKRGYSYLSFPSAR